MRWYEREEQSKHVIVSHSMRLPCVQHVSTSSLHRLCIPLSLPLHLVLTVRTVPHELSDTELLCTSSTSVAFL